MAARPRRVPRRVTTTTNCATRRANHAWARSSGRSENIPVFDTPKSAVELLPSHPSTRGVGHRRERWGEMRWTRQRRARELIAGRISVSDRGAQTNGAVSPVSQKLRWGCTILRSTWRRWLAYGKTVWFWHPLLVLSRRRFSSAQPGLARSLIRRRR